MKSLLSSLTILTLSAISLPGENIIPDAGDLAKSFVLHSEGKGDGELNIASGSNGGMLVYTGTRGNITLARYAPNGKLTETLAREVSLAFQLEGVGSLGLFIRSSAENAYLLIVNRSGEGQGTLRLFKRPELSQASFTMGMLASQTFDWPQGDNWYHLTLQVESQADGSVVLQAAISDEAKSLVAEINKSDLKLPLLNAGGITLRFYGSETRPANIKIDQFSFSPAAR